MDIEQPTAKEIGINLRYLRERKKLSVKEVSAALEISPKTYYHYEHGYREPNLAMLINMANFFNCSLDDLVSNSVGGKVDSTISFESFKIEEGKIKRRSRSKVTTLLDNVIVVHDGLDILTFLRSDTIVSGERMLFRYKNKYIIGKIYENNGTVSFEDEGNLVTLRKRELEDLLVFGLYQGKLQQDFQIDGFF
jgi:transcriptional regulator with XRE-family HTH domain